MYFRIALAVVTLFWGTMTFLLWRAEYGDRNQAGNAVPLEVVWKKILTAPDNSTLDIYHKGKKAGFCRWAATVGEDPRARKGVVDGQPPEGMVTRPTGYRLDLDGNLNETEDISRVHFNLELKLSNPRAWQEFSLRANVERDLWELQLLESDQKIQLRTDIGGGRTERTIPFADLRNPEALARDLGIALPLVLMGVPQLAAKNPQAQSLSPAITWQARNDWITIGHTSARVYRLRAKLLDRFEMMVLVSPVGEILRVELPDGWVLVNDQVGTL
jgi:hypothetical protein